MGHFLFDMGAVDQRTIDEFAKESEKTGKGDTFKYAWVMDSLKDERYLLKRKGRLDQEDSSSLDFLAPERFRVLGFSSFSSFALSAGASVVFFRGLLGAFF